MSTVVYKRKRGNLAKGIVFGIYNRGSLVPLSDITNPTLVMRSVSDTGAGAVTLAGVLAAYTDTENTPAKYNVSYTWDAADPDTPGRYILELHGDDPNGRAVIYPDPGRFVVVITDDADG